MICKQCRVNLEDGTSVCPVCGCKQTEEAAVETETAVQICDEQISEEVNTSNVSSRKNKKLIRIIAVVCAAVLLVGAAAGAWYMINGGWKPRENDIHYHSSYTKADNKAQKAADKVVATAGGEELTNSELQVYYWMEVYSFLDSYGQQLSAYGLDLTKPLSEQYINKSGDTWEQYFLKKALNNWHNCQSLMIMAEVEGFQTSDLLNNQLEDVKKSLEETCAEFGYANATEMIRADMGPGADVDAYMAYMTLYYGGVEYVEHIYDKLGFTQSEIEQYYAEFSDTIKQNYGVDKTTGKLVDVRHILVCPQGGTENADGSVTHTIEEWDACLAKAEKIIEEWESGEATSASFGVLANEYSEDPGSNTSGGLYTYVYEGEMVPNFNDWCFDENRKPGDVGLVQTEYGFHVMYYVEGDEGWIRFTEQQMLTDACTVIMENAMNSNPIKINYKDIVLGQVDLVD